MSEWVLHNVRLVRPGRDVLEGYIHVADGRIVSTGAGQVPPDVAPTQHNGGGQLLTPGLVDMHTHGMRRWNYDQGPEHLKGAVRSLGRYGTTTVVPTIVPAKTAGLLDRLRALAEMIPEIEAVSIPGLHLEGPFVAIAGAACETRDGDVGFLEDMIAACEGRVAVMSIAPEVKNIIPVIEHLMANDIIPFITHTRAGVEDTVKAIDAGARHATHFYDVFPVPELTEPGVRPVGAVETILADARATCDFICDGIHVHPMAIRAALAAKGWEGISLITDASIGAGLLSGMYETPWGYSVEVTPGDAPRIADRKHPMRGALAGSALTMDRGMNNLLAWLDLPPEQVWAMGTRNPAGVIGAKGKGTLDAGADADLVLWREANDGLKPHCTWVNGEIVFEA